MATGQTTEGVYASLWDLACVLGPRGVSGAATVEVILGSCGQRSRLAGVTRQGREETGKKDASAGLPVQPRAALPPGLHERKAYFS